MDYIWSTWRCQELSILRQICGKSDLLQQFAHLKTDEDRFAVALGVVVDHADSFFDSKLKCKSKDSEKAEYLLDDANRHFAAGDHTKALEEYTKSLMNAVGSSEELALAYANRSGVLYNLDKFAESIEDIDRALDGKCPDRLKMKLYKRKGLCYRRLGKRGAEALFRSALNWVDKTTLKKEEMKDAENELRIFMTSSVPAVKKSTIAKPQPLPKVDKPNPEIPCASEAVVLKYSKEFGRHLVARRQIKAGETLALEKPYCQRRQVKSAHTQCAHCLKKSSNLVPCQGCINEAYCSEACKDRAWGEYHEIKCPVLGFLHDFEIAHTLKMSLRMVLMASQKGRNLDELKRVKLEVDENDDPRTKGFCNDGKFHSDQYCSIYSLVGHADKCDIETLLQRATWVAMTVCLLDQKTEMFGKKLELATMEDNPDVVFVGGFILTNVHICSINTKGGAQGDVQLALNSLINHSCAPNAQLASLGDHLVSVLSALCTIKRGEEIFVSYGPRYTEMRKRQRHENLKDSYFTCKCVACTEEWPLLRDSPSH